MEVKLPGEVPYHTLVLVFASVLHIIIMLFSVGDCIYGPRITVCENAHAENNKEMRNTPDLFMGYEFVQKYPAKSTGRSNRFY
jgi:hypothetical protein